jgi:hypothetical protein
MHRHRCGDWGATRRTKLKTGLRLPMQIKQIEHQTKPSATKDERGTKLNGRPHKLKEEIERRMKSDGQTYGTAMMGQMRSITERQKRTDGVNQTKLHRSITRVGGTAQVRQRSF